MLKTWITLPRVEINVRKTEGAINNGQSREISSSGYTRHTTKTNKTKTKTQHRKLTWWVTLTSNKSRGWTQVIVKGTLHWPPTKAGGEPRWSWRVSSTQIRSCQSLVIVPKLRIDIVIPCISCTCTCFCNLIVRNVQKCGSF